MGKYMKTIKTLAGLAVASAGFAFLESFRELNTVKLTEYKIKTDRPDMKGRKLIFLSDFHEAQKGKLNKRIVKLIRGYDPEFVLIGGDMINGKSLSEDIEPAVDLINRIASDYKVLYALGNHERRIIDNYHGTRETWKSFISRLDDNVSILINSRYDLGGGAAVYGLNIPLKYYRRTHFPDLSVDSINAFIGLKPKDEYSILLGHTPDFMNGYSDWGADLVLAGHFHGGILKLPFTRLGLVTPRMRLFSNPVYGRVRRKDTTMLITNGIGQHSIKLKLNNIPEVVGIEFI